MNKPEHKTLSCIQTLRTRALRDNNLSAYWALTLAIDFYLGLKQSSVDEDIERVDLNL